MCGTIENFTIVKMEALERDLHALRQFKLEEEASEEEAELQSQVTAGFL